VKYYLYIILAALCFSLIGVSVKLIGSDVHHISIAFFRVLLGFIFLLVVLPFVDRGFMKVSKKDIRDYFVIGVMFAASIVTYNAAYQYAPVNNVVLIDSMAPILIIFLATFMLKERLTKTKLKIFAIGFLGMIVMNPFQIGSAAYGNILAMISTFIWCFMLINMRKQDKKNGVGHVIWFLFFAMLLLFPFAFYYGFGNYQEVWPYLIVLGFICTGLAYLLYNIALSKIEIGTGSILMNIVYPLGSILLAIMIINEEVSIRTVVGGSLLIFAGIYMEQHDRKLKKAIAEMRASE